MHNKFDEECKKILLLSEEQSDLTKKNYIGTEHLLLAIMSFDNGISELLNKLNVSYTKILDIVNKSIKLKNKNTNPKIYTPLLNKIIQNEIELSKENNYIINIYKIFTSMLKEGDGYALRILKELEINISNLYSLLVEKTKSNSSIDLLDKYGVDLTKCENDYSHLIGRENELSELIKILLKTTKRNPILIGPAGIGKTSIVEELSYRIKNGKVPTELKNKKIYMISSSTLVAGTKYRGEFEERFEKILNEIALNKNIIIFIDEIHTLINAGGAEGAIDASNILKPYLARGDISMIGATTLDEYNSSIAKDKAFARRFSQIYLNEPDKKDLLDILKSKSKYFSNNDSVLFLESAIKKIIKLSKMYNSEGKEPDKSLDFMEEFISNYKLNSINKTIDEEIQKFTNKKNEYIFKKNWKMACIYKHKENKLKEKQFESKTHKSLVTITDQDIIKYFEKKYKINNYKTVHIINNELINNIIESYKESNLVTLKITNEKKWHSIFNILSKKVFYYNYLKIDLAECNSINKLIGMPLGYKDSDKLTPLISFIKNFPYGLIIFTNYDKAILEVKQLINGIIKNKEITDNSNNNYYSYNKVLLTISCVKNRIGFSNKTKEKEISTKPVYKRDELVNNYQTI